MKGSSCKGFGGFVCTSVCTIGGVCVFVGVCMEGGAILARNLR